MPAHMIILSVIALLFSAAPAMASELPTHLQRQLDKAASLDDPFIIDAVVEKMARNYPAQKPALAQWWQKRQSAVTVKTAAKAQSENKWYIPKEAEAELAMSFTNGNVDKEEVYAAGSVGFEMGDWYNSSTAKFESEKEKGIRVTEKYNASNKTKYHLSKKDYVFLDLSGERDTLSGIQYRAGEALGYGRYLIKEKGLVWAVEAAPSLQQLAYTDGATQYAIGAFLESNFKWAINDHWKFRNKLQSKISDSVAITKFHNRLDTSLTKHLALRLGFDVDHYSSVPDRDKNFDFKTRMGLVYGY